MASCTVYQTTPYAKNVKFCACAERPQPASMLVKQRTLVAALWVEGAASELAAPGRAGNAARDLASVWSAESTQHRAARRVILRHSGTPKSRRGPLAQLDRQP